MGLTYVLVKKKEKEFFTLDKGPWTEVLYEYEYPSGHFLNAAVLQERLAEELDFSSTYLEKLSTSIISWVGNTEVELVEDVDQWVDRGYDKDNWEETGSRFSVWKEWKKNEP